MLKTIITLDYESVVVISERSLIRNPTKKIPQTNQNMTFFMKTNIIIIYVLLMNLKQSYSFDRSNAYRVVFHFHEDGLVLITNQINVFCLY